MSNRSGDDGSHVFIIRLWREPSTSTDTEPEWRALIENVSTGTRSLIQDMSVLQTLLAMHRDEIWLDDFLAS